MTDPDPIRLAHDERAELADFLAGLTAEQWDAPTLCHRWSVRDVVAHIISYDDLGPTAFVGRFAAGRFNPDQVNQVGVDQYRQLTPDELLAELKGHLHPAGLTARFGGRIGLVDGLIHHQDIRRALRAPRDVPTERLATALPFARVAPPIRAFSRVRGLRLVATDVGWTSGKGPVVEGPAEPLLMAMAGRADALDELGGDGLPTLVGRVAA
ncbi:maleylpyruvate isomerase family mycothiol-dependent enzyme [Actinomycetospora straminea]|uniref:Maleylpyruvate isomerase family mycothiol-dependent enzyme n=1 Tax=Actinomycetospora straminea TaxID=663607 RepID=A0ABP9FCW0_9PSEU|nr:maleylpyruvate isomerase family mycothiol-dependent enzyme [Actinomycetospora straminea]MDD7934817.1 maleylpyruvate isomerase family mycothiol-dependent enzyme [Actinomycetospora straminea]